MKTEKNKWWTKWYFWTNLIFVIIWGNKFISEYVRIRNSEYGRIANEKRQSLGIPIIADYLKPIGAPKSKFDGLRWETSKNPSLEVRLIQRSKTVEANKNDGWIWESDAIRFYIDDSTCFQLNLHSKIIQNKVEFSGELGKVDTRNEDLDLENRYPTYEWYKLDSIQLDSIKRAWKIYRIN
jgi:hypothetical protein